MKCLLLSEFLTQGLLLRDRVLPTDNLAVNPEDCNKCDTATFSLVLHPDDLYFPQGTITRFTAHPESQVYHWASRSMVHKQPRSQMYL